MQYNSLSHHHFSKDIRKYLKKGNTKGVIFGNFGACNFGDEAILAGELEELKSLPTVQVRIAARYQSRIKELHRVEAFSLFNTFAYFKALSTSYFFIIGGGGLFCKNDSGIRGIIFQLYTIALFLTLPLLLQKHIFVLGLGFYDNANPLIKRLAIFHFRFAKILGVRDHASYLTLRKHNLPVREYKDNSFLLPLSSTQKKILTNTTRLFTIGVAINRPQTEEGVTRVTQEITDFILKNHPLAHFAFYTLDFHPSYPSDRKYAKEIISRVKKQTSHFSYELVKTSVSPSTLFSSFSECDFMITSRLHGSIFAYRLGIPFFGIAYDKKCSSFLEAIGHHFVHPEEVIASEIQRAFQLIQNKKYFKESYERSLSV